MNTTITTNLQADLNRRSVLKTFLTHFCHTFNGVMQHK